MRKSRWNNLQVKMWNMKNWRMYFIVFRINDFTTHKIYLSFKLHRSIFDIWRTNTEISLKRFEQIKINVLDIAESDSLVRLTLQRHLEATQGHVKVILKLFLSNTVKSGDKNLKKFIHMFFELANSNTKSANLHYVRLQVTWRSNNEIISKKTEK